MHVTIDAPASGSSAAAARRFAAGHELADDAARASAAPSGDARKDSAKSGTAKSHAVHTHSKPPDTTQIATPAELRGRSGASSTDFSSKKAAIRI